MKWNEELRVVCIIPSLLNYWLCLINSNVLFIGGSGRVDELLV